jgi:hypothetical protein
LGWYERKREVVRWIADKTGTEPEDIQAMEVYDQIIDRYKWNRDQRLWR